MHSSRFHSELRLFILGPKLLQLGFLNFLFCFFFHIFFYFLSHLIALISKEISAHLFLISYVTTQEIRFPWFRVHIVILNDPGRLISVHNTHTALIAGWSTQMVLYELILVDPSDPVYNPIWRQGNYVIPFISRLGVVQSLFNWSITIQSYTYQTSQVHFNKSSFSFRITLLQLAHGCRHIGI